MLLSPSLILNAYSSTSVRSMIRTANLVFFFFIHFFRGTGYASFIISQNLGARTPVGILKTCLLLQTFTRGETIY